jgi:hypothetical protein
LAAGEEAGEEVEAGGVVGCALLLAESSEDPHAASTARAPSKAPVSATDCLIVMNSPTGYALLLAT